MEKLNSYLDIAAIPDNHSYTSPKRKAGYFWTLLFGFLTGDLNPIHINPFTTTNFKSKLGGLARHGISTVAQAESFIFKIFSFTEPTEVIAKGYDKIRYLSPVNMGDEITYTYTLLQKKVNEEKNYTECAWKIKGTNQNDNDVFMAEWIILYSAIQKNIIKSYVRPFGWFSPQIEIHDTPMRTFLLRLWITLCCAVIIWVFFHSWN